MLQSLTIQNYALISSLEIDFESGFSVITGETGAGKSILLGALSMLLGKRADASVLKNKDLKCVVEGVFNLKNYSFKQFFEENEIDYEDVTILRREISQNGKSRAFINDTPVNLPILKLLGSLLTDIHSQHENPELNDYNFQLKVIDSFAGITENLNNYKTKYKEYKKTLNELNELIEISKKEKADNDFIKFRFDELHEAKLVENEQETLEEERENLTHSEEIKRNLVEGFQLLTEDDFGVISRLRRSFQGMEKIKNFYKKAGTFYERLNTTFIELSDLSQEIETSAEDVEFNPERLVFVNSRLDLIYTLQRKHKVETLLELIEIKLQLQNRLDTIQSYDQTIDELQKKLQIQVIEIQKDSTVLTKLRKESSKKIETQIGEFLNLMGMPSASFKINFFETEDFTETGKDLVRFMFSANKSSELQEISKVASGGEISRLMLSIKALIANSISLPTVVFDEIDTGVSGEIAGKMGDIMLRMSQNMQVIDITHLPQIAGKAKHHYFVYKYENEGIVQTTIKKLSNEERVVEIAKMLSGDNVTQAAMLNAKELLGEK